MSAAAIAPWPAALAGTPAVAVIERAISRRRLGHSLLLHGDDADLLAAVAQAIADRLLQGDGPAPRGFGAGGHPDCFTLRPAGKMRQISADATRELIAQVQVTASVGLRKVAVVHEADRMNATAANIFLKTLEEPPAHTTLLLLTTRPYALLPTIRSRCLHFKFAPIGANLSSEALAKGDPALAALWVPWLADYQAWLGRLTQRPADKPGIADHLLSLYGLVARFATILEQATARAWAKQLESLPPELAEEEQVAIQVGLARGLRARLFAEIAGATQAFARPRLQAGEPAARRAFTAAIDRFEEDAGLLHLNLNESAALEDFLLASMRLWAKR